MKKVKFAAMQLANVEKQESLTLPDPLLGPQVVRVFSQQVDLERRYCDNILHWLVCRKVNFDTDQLLHLRGELNSREVEWCWLIPVRLDGRTHVVFMITFKFFLYTFVHCDDTEGLPTKFNIRRHGCESQTN